MNTFRIILGPTGMVSVKGLGFLSEFQENLYSPPEVHRIWGIWGSYYTIPKAIFYILKGGYK